MDESRGRRNDAAWIAICRSQAVIEFDIEGHVLWANDLFLAMMGYRLEDVAGRHHGLFCTPELAASPAYAAFWQKLAAGDHHAGEYPWARSDGAIVHLQATYSPIFDDDGRPVRILEIATDVTESRRRSAELEAISIAMQRSQATIEFAPDGTIMDANDRFLDSMGYTRAEIVGRHHRIFCSQAEAASEDYRTFWQRLGRGDYEGGVYKRLARDGRDVWLQATYNPVLDPDGRPLKVVKLATDITGAKLRQAELEARSVAMDRSQAVIEFTLDGTVLKANENFLTIMGYASREVVGRHHRMFCDPDHAGSAEYRSFWQKLGSGHFDAGVYRRVAKDGRTIWLQATYNPILSTLR